MLVYLLAFGVWLHVFAWGSGISWLLAPRRWRRFWPLFALTAGLTFQSLVVWGGALADLRGTNAYVFWAELLPAVVLGWALFRTGGRRFGRELLGSWSVLAVSILVLLVLAVPYANYYRHNGLTTASLGSCDAADYAGGARALMEFARSDRTGFLGLTEVTRVMSIDHFFDFYLRSMHFTPCALVALNGTVFHCATYQIIGLMAALFLASAVPLVFLIARTLVGQGALPSLGVAVLFGFSPVNWYAVYQTAMAHLLAAQAIALLTWTAWMMWKHGLAKNGWGYAGLLALAYALLIGSYSFIVVICLIPALGFAGGIAVCTGQWRRFFRWLLWTLLPLGAVSVVFYLRVASIAERFAILKQYDLGWSIPYLWPDAWLGVVKNALLEPVAEPFHSVGIGLIGAALVWTFVGFGKGRGALLFRAGCLAVPAILGSLYLFFQGMHWGADANRSYNAYKLFCVFYPGILPCLCLWVALAYRRVFERILFWTLLALLVFGVARADQKFLAAMKNPPHLVERELMAVQSIEGISRVESLNMMIPDMWSRLWANALLLKKPQYFATHTYEGRMNTPLRGDWDLNGGVIDLNLPHGRSMEVNSNYSLAHVTCAYFVRVRLAEGWHDPERLRHPRTINWVWSKGNATIEIFNPHPTPLKASLHFELRSARPRDLSFWFNQQKLSETNLVNEIKRIDIGEITLAPGKNCIELHSKIPAAAPDPNDQRSLGFALYVFSANVKE
jgi:hypothetical protein